MARGLSGRPAGAPGGAPGPARRLARRAAPGCVPAGAVRIGERGAFRQGTAIPPLAPQTPGNAVRIARPLLAQAAVRLVGMRAGSGPSSSTMASVSAASTGSAGPGLSAGGSSLSPALSPSGAGSSVSPASRRPARRRFWPVVRRQPCSGAARGTGLLPALPRPALPRAGRAGKAGSGRSPFRGQGGWESRFGRLRFRGQGGSESRFARFRFLLTGRLGKPVRQVPVPLTGRQQDATEPRRGHITTG